MTNPKKGEIWLVQLDPTRGQEIQKTRPAVVISSDIFSSIAMRIIIPVATWQPKFQNRPFMIPIQQTDENGLDTNSAGNVLQVRSVTTQRFVRCLGKVSAAVMEELLIALFLCVDYDPENKN
ncbi:type II toxin-antitoxin system PemK/MazF family toxin [Nostoc sp. FACHB-87]|uniref:mRNA interferase n=1 Tax=Nostoc spongiaeforme FACHB-130 TaxID=1357510 RepID=A0ABR8G4P3_9NOSO|nr:MULTISPECIES: type II toxin-antitoxin system PemK/MazF family toxin [Nostocaceae]MBD2300337.1 type II toxin-antitoxin system PemK/MazF family toxin [Nostoc sp. FACHB-190]MBD2455047.1 type II toxin-antitoxin system PemK/MazF family toxin [Nostoc sp. FACHB-87]MBD2474632.1 type II toxin-antitoxin system PemK/MazF family toxin [Anabaena sp. FACHB-83]MBD2598245.1 type II toxin-antitoxin system PemK/MazF family toxin [Nostoc spongiaeforme FACHB-130]